MKHKRVVSCLVAALSLGLGSATAHRRAIIVTTALLNSRNAGMLRCGCMPSI